MPGEIDTSAIEKIIPHRFPFLLVDKIIEIVPGKSAVGIKNVTANEWYFAGHFPGRPIMPGVLIIEALAQVGAIATLSVEGREDELVLFAGMDKVRFKREVNPGDRLDLKVEIERSRGRFGKGRGEASVDGKLAATAELMFMTVDHS